MVKRGFRGHCRAVREEKCGCVQAAAITDSRLARDSSTYTAPRIGRSLASFFRHATATSPVGRSLVSLQLRLIGKSPVAPVCRDLLRAVEITSQKNPAALASCRSTVERCFAKTARRSLWIFFCLTVHLTQRFLVESFGLESTYSQRWMKLNNQVQKAALCAGYALTH